MASNARYRPTWGRENAEDYGRRNSGEGAVLIRVTPTKIIGEKNTASWD
jgi:hypothetical protein